MKQFGKRLVTLTLALLMAMSVLPEEWHRSAQAAGAYGKVTADGVKLRKKASTSAAYWFKLDTGYVCQVLDVTASGDITWYNVEAVHPDPGSTRTYIGYIHGDFFTPLTEQEAAEYEANGKLEDSSADTSTDTAPDTSTGDTSADDAAKEEDASQEDSSADTSTGSNTNAYAGATGQITNDGVNFRESEGGNMICKLDRGTVVEVLTIPPVIDTNHWYKVRYAGDVGYIMSTFLQVVSTGDPNGTPTDPDADLSLYGYVKLVLSSANLRLTPAGTVGAQWENTGEVLAVVAPPVTEKNFVWYPVEFEGNRYYVREDTVQLQATPGSSGSSSGSTSGGTTTTPTIVGYVRTTKSGVNLRLKPAGTVVTQINKGEVLPMIANVTKDSGYYWYNVQTPDNVRGYLRGDCVVVCNADGSNIESGSTPVVTDPPAATSYGHVKTIKDKVNLRTKPAGSSQEQIALGVVVPMTGKKVKSGSYYWYPVKAASGKTGYLRSDCVMECNADGSDPSVTDAPETSEPTESTPPTETTPPTTSAYGYVMVTKDSVNLRRTAAGTKIGEVNSNSVWPMTGAKVKAKGYYWYPVNVEGKNGFIREDCCFQLSKTQQESYLAGNGVPDEDTVEATSNYVITTLDKVNLRVGATKDSTAKFNVALGTVMAYKSTATVSGAKWYRVIYSNTEVWVLGSCVDEMTASEYEEWAAKNPNNTPQTEVIAGYVRTTADGVNLRKTAAGTVINRVDKGNVYSYSKTEAASGYTWYYVKTPVGYGYLRSDCVMECNSDGSNFAPIVTTPPSSSGQEASYTTLKLGSSGTAVKNLVEELKNQGYYSGDVTSSYTSAVEAAVRAFQTAKGLTVDGIAGSQTQHALFGTVPIGSGDSSNLSFTHYPAEKIDWFTGGIQQLWPKGANYKIYDVKTGIVWWAHRWSGFNHADIETLTAADTARLCKIYGVSKASEINNKKHWHRRPCLVTIGTRTFACSLYGVPHNPDGDTIPDNDMIGQLCLHFTNSMTSDTKVVDSNHQKAIDYAYQNAPGGQKK